jgi:hypothetical protein
MGAVEASGFERYEVDQLRSIAHLFPKSKGRRGLYVLEFSGAEEYVGQTLNVVGRVADHRRRWDDIEAVRFRRISARGDLDGPEKELIHARLAKGLVLRNNRHSVVPMNFDTDLDWDVAPGEQAAWLNDDVWLPDVRERVDDPGQRQRRMAAYQRLKEHPRFDDVVEAVGRYVADCIPRPRATELTFWSLSAAPSTNRSSSPRLAVVSINSMETLVIGHDLGDPGQLCGFVNVAGERLSSFGRRSIQPITRRRVPYEAGGPDVRQVHFRDPKELIDLLRDHRTGLVAAARELNLRAMRKGPTFQWRWHCLALADHIFDQGSSGSTGAM